MRPITTELVKEIAEEIDVEVEDVEAEVKVFTDQGMSDELRELLSTADGIDDFSERVANQVAMMRLEEDRSKAIGFLRVLCKGSPTPVGPSQRIEIPRKIYTEVQEFLASLDT